MQISTSRAETAAVFGIYRLLIVAFVLFIIYFAQAIVIPITVAALLTFLLSPLVTHLEKYLGRTISIFLAVIVVFSIIGIIGYVFAKQLILFGSNFQTYFDIIQKKISAIQFPEGGLFDRITGFIGNLKDELLGSAPKSDLSEANLSAAAEAKLFDIGTNFLGILQSFFGSFINFLTMSGIVILLVFFMLFNREDIRGRVIKLMGRGRIGSTTTLMNEAIERVYGYLSRLFIVNLAFGIIVTLGLYFIGIPNPVLWGGVAAIMRFIPYIGVWIATIIPIAFSFIITESWLTPLITITFFLITETVFAYFIEPFYYGIVTGVSSFALILAAIFWTWLWGPIGLLLSTPITVCLVVLGQHLTNWDFLRVLLSHEQALTPIEECYHRLLSNDSSEAMDLIESYLQKNSLTFVYDSILLPILSHLEIDFQRETIDEEQKDTVNQNIHEIIAFLNIEHKEEKNSDVKAGKVFCLPSQTVRDELGTEMLVQLLEDHSIETELGRNRHINDILETIGNMTPDLICIAVVAPGALSHTRFLCASIHRYKPNIPIVVGLWGSHAPVDPAVLDKLSGTGATKIVFTLTNTIETIVEMLKSK